MAGDDDFDRFAEGFAGGTPQLVARELVADTQTPVSAYLRLAAGSRNTFLLESVEGGETAPRRIAMTSSPMAGRRLSRSAR
jgi:anthranilate synthase component 1